MKKKLTPWFFPIFLSIIVVGTILGAAISTNPVRSVIILVGIAVTIVTLLIWAYLEMTNFSGTSRPVVYKCEYDKVIAVCSEQAFRLWQESYEVARGAGLLSKEFKPAPQFTAFFTDDDTKARNLMHYCAGNKKDCDRLLKGCRAITTEIFIPSWPRYARMQYHMPLEAIWKTIHGKLPPERAPEYEFL